MSLLSKGGLCYGIAAWLLLIGFGLWRFSTYESTPGETGRVADNWPVASVLPRDSSRPFLVMAVHPHCPCTRASLRELARILAVSPSNVQACVLFVLPTGTPEGWERTDLWTTAAGIPGVRLVRDRGGREAARFGLETSGECVLFSAAGKRLFAGGITLARGHEGDNPGEDALVDALCSREASSVATALAAAADPVLPVFGCPLQSKTCPITVPGKR